ncbi:hypothetical protein ARMSODRAFT_979397 [Armillaria solidipes]|uniref:Uncharacterized protein n=1 Tax=Armillaria solidipes TaxID=1076256 RepID=A0A2H3B567_9AGAR|nr:hypothetical protein ARMSODRAFT_979397 [Armillaria solidipes]
MSISASNEDRGGKTHSCINNQIGRPKPVASRSKARTMAAPIKDHSLKNNCQSSRLRKDIHEIIWQNNQMERYRAQQAARGYTCEDLEKHNQMEEKNIGATERTQYAAYPNYLKKFEETAKRQRKEEIHGATRYAWIYRFKETIDTDQENSQIIVNTVARPRNEKNRTTQEEIHKSEV